MDDPLGLTDERLNGKYRLDAPVAAGGFAVVYRAWHLSLLKPIAVKVLRVPESLPEDEREAFMQRFAEEARLVARLDHPAIVGVMDFGVSTTPGGRRAPWIVLDWVDGGTLADDLDARRGHGGRTPAQCLRILGPVLGALGWAHAQGVVHRDVKPSNILCQSRAPIDCKLTDFGIARRFELDDHHAPSGYTRTESERRAFSLEYAAPEQVTGTRTGPWTDVHALGLVLTEMLTDRAPHDATEKLSLHLELFATERPTPARRGVDVGAWEAVIARAVALHPGDRYPDAQSLYEALREALPRARHPTEKSPAPRAARVILAAAALTALVTLGAWALAR